MFYLLNHKFQHEARKAVFSELSMQLEFCCEDLTLDTELSVFDEMIEIIAELKTQATSRTALTSRHKTLCKSSRICLSASSLKQRMR
jgi:hypothetical protein